MGWKQSPGAPLKAHQNCNKNPLSETKLSNCYFTPTCCWSSFKHPLLTCFKWKCSASWAVGEGWFTLLPVRQKYGYICKTEEAGHDCWVRRLSQWKELALTHHLSSVLISQCSKIRAPYCKRIPYSEFVLYSLVKKGGYRKRGELQEDCAFSWCHRGPNLPFKESENNKGSQGDWVDQRGTSPSFHWQLQN